MILRIRNENDLWKVYRERGIMWFAVGVGFDISDAWRSAEANGFHIRDDQPARALRTSRILELKI